MKTVKLSDVSYSNLVDLVKRGDFRSKSSAFGEAVLTALRAISPREGIVVIDAKPADNGANRNQDQWLKYDFGNGKRMISAWDLCRAPDNNPKALGSMRKDFNDSWICTETKNMFNGNDLSVQIFPNYGSNPKFKINVKEVPIYQGTPAKEVVEGKGMEYAQAITGLHEPSKILDNLEKLSQKGVEDIRFWTPGMDSRKAYSARAVRFGCVSGEFHVSGDDVIVDSNIGRSRGVSVSSSGASAKKYSK